MFPSPIAVSFFSGFPLTVPEWIRIIQEQRNVKIPISKSSTRKLNIKKIHRSHILWKNGNDLNMLPNCLVFKKVIICTIPPWKQALLKSNLEILRSWNFYKIKHCEKILRKISLNAIYKFVSQQGTVITLDDVITLPTARHCWFNGARINLEQVHRGDVVHSHPLRMLFKVSHWVYY